MRKSSVAAFILFASSTCFVLANTENASESLKENVLRPVSLLPVLRESNSPYKNWKIEKAIKWGFPEWRSDMITVKKGGKAHHLYVVDNRYVLPDIPVPKWVLSDAKRKDYIRERGPEKNITILKYQNENSVFRIWFVGNVKKGNFTSYSIGSYVPS